MLKKLLLMAALVSVFGIASNAVVAPLPTCFPCP